MAIVGLWNHYRILMQMLPEVMAHIGLWNHLSILT